MGFIISELDDIKDKCGDEVEMGKINNYTVHMILAKMYLNHNAWFDDHSDDSYYRKCVDELNVIIESNKFSLAPNYADNFKEDISSSPEIIFGIPFEYLYASGNYFANLWMNEAGRATFGFTGCATGGGAPCPSSWILMTRIMTPVIQTAGSAVSSKTRVETPFMWTASL